MTSHLHLVFRRDGNDPIEEVRDPLPVRVGIDLPGNRQRRILLRALEDELAVARGSASLRGTAARNADEGEVVFHLEDAGLRAIPDHLADVVDVAIAFRALAKIDGWQFRARDLRRAHR